MKMIEAKLTSKGQITIPIEIRRLLDIDTGDSISFNITESGIIIGKADRPKTIQERFAHYDIKGSKDEVSKSMEEIDTGQNIGVEKI